MNATNRTPTAADLSDAELIAASVADAEAFGLLFNRHVDAIHGYVSRRVGSSLAEELTAETFARAFSVRASFVPLHESASPWLYGIATNLIHNAKRAEQRQLTAYGKAAATTTGHPAEFDQADARLDARRATPLVVEALLGLVPGDRDALVLYAWQDLSYEEVGIALGIPAGTVASRINRARRRVRASLGFEGPDDLKGTV